MNHLDDLKETRCPLWSSGLCVRNSCRPKPVHSLQAMFVGRRQRPLGGDYFAYETAQLELCLDVGHQAGEISLHSPSPPTTIFVSRDCIRVIE